MSILEKMRSQRLGTPEAPPAEPPPAPPTREPEPEENSDLTRGEFRMFSNVLGIEVGVVFPDGNGNVVLVDDVRYRANEIRDLLGRHLNPAELRAVHEVKRTFNGQLGGHDKDDADNSHR